ncbi:hypothetical protein B1J94_19505 [Leptospira kirschneri serovar Grippotyphosa]|nr:hypothetical protein B1J94_19505 [Leptospira kirschneri serovar Grippotyphosa]
MNIGGIVTIFTYQFLLKKLTNSQKLVLSFIFSVKIGVKFSVHFSKKIFNLIYVLSMKLSTGNFKIKFCKDAQYICY